MNVSDTTLARPLILLFSEAINDLHPILDVLEGLSLVCADRLTCLTLICLCNAKSGQETAAHLYASKTLQFITTNAKILSDTNYSALVSECVTIAAKVKAISEDEVPKPDIHHISTGELIQG